MTHYTITAPVKGKDDKTRYPRVGVLFENHGSVCIKVREAT